MKRISEIVFWFLLFAILSGCNNILTDKKNSFLGEKTRDSGKLLISSPLPTITSINASNYPIKGFCAPKLGDIEIVVKSPEVVKIFPCNSKGEFSGVLNVSAVTSNPAHVLANQGPLKTVVDILPVNDQKGPVTAPTATAPGSYVGGGNIYNMSIVCNEKGEFVKISGGGLDPSTQFYTCTEGGEETVSLSLLVPVETQDPNNLTLSSEDKYGNPSKTNSSVNLPIDTKGPVVSISNAGNIVEGRSAQFTVMVTESRFTPNYTVNTSGVETKSYSCTSNPCNITTGSISSTGSLTLSLEANSISDDAGNTGNSVLRSSSLIVNAVGTLLISNPLPIINTQNASAYTISGDCDGTLGNVNIKVASPEKNKEVPCDSSGYFSGVINISDVSSNPAVVSITQDLKTVNADPQPVNDQTPITNAPTVADQTPKNGASTSVSIECNEAGEVVTFTNNALNPSEQTYTCTSSESENVSLTFKNAVETENPNNVTVSSKDANGNKTTNEDSFNLPIDNVSPTVSVAAGSDITQGDSAEFTITVTEGTGFSSFTPSVSSGSVTSGACTNSPCSITVSGASTGTLTLTVAKGVVTDSAGNTNAESASGSLTVQATNLSINEPLPTGSTNNNTAYPISGNCDAGKGDVKITIGTPNFVEKVSCAEGSGTYSKNLDISSIDSDTLSVSVEQNGNTKTPEAAPVNDQTPITKAPTVADQTPKNGTSTSVAIGCNEANEVVTFTNSALNPESQTYTCVAQGTESTNLTFKNAIETENPNNVTVSSKDANGNKTTNNDSFNLPIDNVSPTVSVAAGSDITQGDSAEFTITVTEGTGFSSFTPSVSSGSITSGACVSSPCSITVSGASTGTLTLTVADGVVTDSAGNTNTESASESLTVQATNLSINEPLPTGNTNNNTAYPISGNCDAGKGDVKITIGTPNFAETVSCAEGSGTYSKNLDISSIDSDTLSVSVEQNNNTKTPEAAPVNDQTPIMNAPTVADQAISKGTNLTVFLECNESGEIVTFTNSALSPETQTYTCAAQETESTNLTFKNAVETENPNNVTVSSKDANGNTTTNEDSFNLPIDNIAPTVSVASGSDITQGDSAEFTITVTEGTGFSSFTPSVSSGSVTSGACASSPCSITVSGASTGTLTLTVAKDLVTDSAGNTNAESASGSLTVQATKLSITDAPTGTSANAPNYPVSGNCDAGKGDVKITVGTPNVVEEVSCAESSGTYSTTLDISSVEANPMNVKAEQNNNVVVFSPSPVNDQTGPTSAPTATAPGSVVGGASYNLAINCNESEEVVSITGNGIDPTPQTYTCTASGSQNFSLTLKQGVNFSSPNNLTLKSKDKYGNPAGSTTDVDVPIDTLGPTVAVTNGGDIVEGESADFTINVTDDHPPSSYNYVPVVSSGTPTPSTCTSNPCNISVSEPDVGTLTVSVTADSISDVVGNTGPEANTSSSLTVSEDPSPTITGVSISSTDSDADTWYEVSDTVTLSVQFSENVTVNTTGGVPRIPVTLTSGSKAANYISGTGTNSLKFSFSIVSGDEQCNGNLSLGALNLNGGTIKDSIGQNSINSGLSSSVSGAQVDAIAPTLSAINVSANDALHKNDRAVTASWTPSDSCGVNKAKMALGHYNASSCSKESLVSFQDIGNVNSYRPVSGVAPFDESNKFDILYSKPYCTTVKVTDVAGNGTEKSSSSWERIYPIPSPAMWFDAADASTLFTDATCTTLATSGNEIACWGDKSSNNNSVIHNGSSSKPSFGGTEQINGLNVVRFESTDALFGEDIFSGSQDELDIYLIIQTVTDTKGILFNFNGTVTDSQGRYFAHYYWSASLKSYWDVGDLSTTNGRRVSGDFGVNRMNGNLINFRNSVINGNQSGWANGVQKFGDTSGHDAVTSGGFALGSVSIPLDVRIAEVLIFDSYLSATDRKIVEAHLACKWKTSTLLPTDHLYNTCGD